MINCLRNKRGFTLIELLVALSITALVMTTISGFLINNVRNFHLAGEQIVVQDEAQASMNVFMEKVMESKGNPLIQEDPGYYTARFDTGTEGSYLYFVHDKNNKDLYWGYGTDSSAADNLSARNIEAFQVSGITLIKVTVKVSIRNTNTELENTVRVRN